MKHDDTLLVYRRITSGKQRLMTDFHLHMYIKSCSSVHVYSTAHAQYKAAVAIWRLGSQSWDRQVRDWRCFSSAR